MPIDPRFDPQFWKATIEALIRSLYPRVSFGLIAAANTPGQYFALCLDDLHVARTDPEDMATLLDGRFVDSIRKHIDEEIARIGTPNLLVEISDIEFLQLKTAFATAIRGKIRCKPLYDLAELTGLQLAAIPT